MNVQDAVAIRFRQICKNRKIALNELTNLSGVTPSILYSLMDGKEGTSPSSQSRNSAMDWICPLRSFSMMLFLRLLSRKSSSTVKDRRNRPRSISFQNSAYLQKRSSIIFLFETVFRNDSDSNCTLYCLQK